MKIEYALFNVVVGLAPSLGLALYRAGEWPDWRRAIQAIAILASIFVLWDYAVTNVWWAFNPAYISGIKIGKLPVEEILFFITVPWSCLIIWHNLKSRVSGTWRWPWGFIVMLGGAVIAGWGASGQLWYTTGVGVALILFGAVSHWCTRWLQSKASTLFLFIVFCLTVVFNGYLTARPIVIYNQVFMSNLRLMTIPVEDILYGLILVGGTAMVYDALVSSRQRLKH